MEGIVEKQKVFGPTFGMTRRLRARAAAGFECEGQRVSR
jgi:hypothetical protein